MDPDKIAKLISEDINVNNGLLLEWDPTLGVGNVPPPPSRKLQINPSGHELIITTDYSKLPHNELDKIAKEIQLKLNQIAATKPGKFGPDKYWVLYDTISMRISTDSSNGPSTEIKSALEKIIQDINDKYNLNRSIDDEG